METLANRIEKPKYLAISAAALLVTAFVLVQPTLNQASAVGLEGLPAYDDCDLEDSPKDPISMNTVRSGSIVKTIHAEKEIFICFLEQGNLPVTVDVTTYLEIYEDMDDREVIATNAIATTCIKEPSVDGGTGGATLIDCESYEVGTSPVFVGSNCGEENEITHPQEMNTVTKGKIAKTIEAQKEVFECELPEGCQEDVDCVDKKVDIVLFTEIYEDLSTQTTIDVQFLSVRCVVLDNDSNAGGDLQDAFVESCIFDEIEN